MSQKGFSVLVIPIVLLVILVVGGFGWVFLKNPQQVAKPTPVSSPAVSVSPTKQTFQNKQLGFEFDLKPGERVAACPEEGVSDAYVFQVTTSPKPESLGIEPLCQAGDVTPDNTVIISRIGTDYWGSSIQDYINELQKDYQLSQAPVNVSNINAVRIKGNLMHPAPLPEVIDKIVFQYQGYFYEIDSIYLERNFHLI